MTYRKIVAKIATVAKGRNKTHSTPSKVCLYCTRISFFMILDRTSLVRHSSTNVSTNPMGFESITNLVIVPLLPSAREESRDVDLGRDVKDTKQKL